MRKFLLAGVCALALMPAVPVLAQTDPAEVGEMYAALDGSFGRSFDRIYIAQQFDAHREALAFMEGYARNGGVWQLQDFARHTVPVIRDHLAMLHSLRGDAVAVNDRTIYVHPDGTRTTVIETE